MTVGFTLPFQMFETINDTTNTLKTIEQLFKNLFEGRRIDPKQDWVLKTKFRTSVDAWVAQPLRGSLTFCMGRSPSTWVALPRWVAPAT